MRLTKKDIEFQLGHINCCYGARLVGKTFFGLMCKEFLKYKDIEEKLGFGLNELVQMLVDGVWEVGGVDSKTMKPEPDCLLFYYVYGIDFKNKCLKVMRAIGYNERSIERSGQFIFSSLHLCKYKKKCLGGWALTNEELICE